METEIPRVEQRREGAVSILTLHNPPLNLLSNALKSNLLSLLREIASEGSSRVLILTGSGQRAFSAGADIHEFPKAPGEGRKASQFEHAVFDALEKFPGPTIAAIQAPALGGGLELALACDFRVAADNTRLGLPEVHIGVFPSSGGTQRLPRIIGEARAKEMIFLGKVIPAKEAFEIGLVNRLAPPDEVVDASLALAFELAEKPALAIQAAREAIHFARSATLEEGSRFEAELIDRVYVSADAREGVQAFLEKRKPVFKHGKDEDTS